MAGTSHYMELLMGLSVIISASEVTTLWRYTNVFIIIIIIIIIFLNFLTFGRYVPEGV